MKFKRLYENDTNEFKITELPGLNGNAYSSSRRLVNRINYSDTNCIYKSDALTEGVFYQFRDDELGGIIVLSMVVNALNLSENKLLNWIRKKLITLGNKINANKKIDDIVSGKYNVEAWTIGKYLSGRYTSKTGDLFTEDSLSVEIIGIDKDKLISIAEDLCKDFKQEAVLVKCYPDNSIFLVESVKGN